MNLIYIFKNIWSLLNSEYRARFITLQLLICGTSVLELLSIAGIGPFMSVVLGVIKVQDIPFVGQFILSNFAGYEIYALGLFVGSLIVVSNIVFSFTLYTKAKFSYSLGADLSNDIVSVFLRHKANKESISKDELISNATFESDRFSRSVINELLMINARGLLSLFIIGYLITQYGSVLLAIVAYLFVVYISISFFVRKRLKKAGGKLTEINQKRLRNINDLYDCFGEIKSYQAEDYFINRQSRFSHELGKNQAKIELFSVLPRYFVEGIIFLTLIILLSITYSKGTNFSLLIPAGVKLGYGIIKLIPQISNIYQAFSNFTGNLNAITAIQNINTKNADNQKELLSHKTYSDSICSAIVVKNITFRRGEKVILNDFSCSFEKGKIYTIKGPSGAGKSTLLSLLFGSLKAEAGEILFFDDNGRNIDNPKISMIPQQNYVIYGNIDSNIAFGEEPQNIDTLSIKAVLDDINLTNEASDNDLLDIKMSGGQVQRIAIGRALYHNYNIIIMDEPTSALDNENTKAIFSILQKIKRDKIIIMVSHSDESDDIADAVIRIGK